MFKFTSVLFITGIWLVNRVESKEKILAIYKRLLYAIALRQGFECHGQCLRYFYTLFDVLVYTKQA